MHRDKDASVVATIRSWPLTIGRRWNFEPHILIMLIFSLLKSVVEVQRNYLLYSRSLLTSQRIIFTVSVIVHIVSSHVPSNFGIFVQPL